jgi:Na+/proline symporter
LAWGGLGAAFGPPLLLSLFWHRTNKYGVAAGFISGMLTVILWNQIDLLKDMIYELVPAFFISTLLTILVSLSTKPNKRFDIITDLSKEK